MTPISLIVEFDIHPEYRDEFLAVIRGHAAATLEQEDGCLRFEVLVPFAEQHLDGSVHDVPNTRIYLHELYRDEGAFAKHQESPLLPTLRKAYQPMVASRTIFRCTHAET